MMKVGINQNRTFYNLSRTNRHFRHITLFGIIVYLYIYIYIERERDTTSEKPVNDQSYGVLDRYGITILYNYKRLKWFVKQHQVHKTK